MHLYKFIAFTYEYETTFGPDIVDEHYNDDNANDDNDNKVEKLPT